MLPQRWPSPPLLSESLSLAVRVDRVHDDAAITSDTAVATRLQRRSTVDVADAAALLAGTSVDTIAVLRRPSAIVAAAAVAMRRAPATPRPHKHKHTAPRPGL